MTPEQLPLSSPSYEELVGLLRKIRREGCLEGMPEYFQDAVDATIARAEGK